MSHLFDPLVLPLLVPAIFGVFIVCTVARIPEPIRPVHFFGALFGAALVVPYEWAVLSYA